MKTPINLKIINSKTNIGVNGSKLLVLIEEKEYIRSVLFSKSDGFFKIHESVGFFTSINHFSIFHDNWESFDEDSGFTNHSFTVILSDPLKFIEKIKELLPSLSKVINGLPFFEGVK